jgi:serine/threonine protein kinase
VLLREDNGKLSTKLADFGFAESFVREDKIVYFSSYKGTKKGYMAPEIHENLHSNRPYDGTKADIFALGVILFTMVCRKYPFEYATPNDSIYNLIASNDYEGFWKEHAKSILQLENR